MFIKTLKKYFDSFRMHNYLLISCINVQTRQNVLELLVIAYQETCYMFSGSFKSFDNTFDGGLFLLIACFKVCLHLALKNEQKKGVESHKYISQLEKTEEPLGKRKLRQHCLSF